MSSNTVQQFIVDLFSGGEATVYDNNGSVVVSQIATRARLSREVRVAVAWILPEHLHLLPTSYDDYEDWLAMINQVVKDINVKLAPNDITKVIVRPQLFEDWCEIHQLEKDQQSLAAYAIALVESGSYEEFNDND